MKRNLLWLIPMACMAASCSSSDDVAVDEIDYFNDKAPFEQSKILIGTGGPATRLIGSIGDMAGSANNKWNEEDIYVFAIEKDSAMTEANMIIKNQHAKAPKGQATGPITWDGGEIKYFPYNGIYDFYGYHIDDARNGSNVYTKDTIKIPYKIDGSQDLMTAKAYLTTENKRDMIDGLIKNEKLGGAAVDYLDLGTGYLKAGVTQKDSILIYGEYDKTFSSYAARRDVQPTLKYSHLLTRLKFYLIAGEKQSMLHYMGDSVNSTDITDTIARGGVFVDSVKLATYSKGNIVITRDSGSVIADTTAVDTLYLQQRSGAQGTPLQNLKQTASSLLWTGKTTTNLANATPIGESMMVVPAESYEARFCTKQYIDKYKNLIAPDKQSNILQQTISLGEGKGPFLPGYSYNIYVIVYGAQNIQVIAQLSGWNDGGNITLDPEFY